MPPASMCRATHSAASKSSDRFASRFRGSGGTEKTPARSASGIVLIDGTFYFGYAGSGVRGSGHPDDHGAQQIMLIESQQITPRPESRVPSPESSPDRFNRAHRGSGIGQLQDRHEYRFQDQ